MLMPLNNPFPSMPEQSQIHFQMFFPFPVSGFADMAELSEVNRVLLKRECLSTLSQEIPPNINRRLYCRSHASKCGAYSSMTILLDNA
jgi:hypothetical protein